MNYSIGQLAKQTGYAVQTLRYYEQIGLMPRSQRSASGQRRYGDDELKRLRFIRHARALGFDLSAIRALLELAQHPDAPCADVDRIAREHLSAIDSKIKQLKALRKELSHMTSVCEKDRIARCRVIEVLSDHGLCETEH